MSLKTIEKLCPHEPPGMYRRWLKRKATRLRRRAEKRDPENAPTKTAHKGWST